MTRFTVVWAADVQDSFTNAWVASNSRTRRSLTDIADWIDTNLADDAHVKGQSIPDRAARTVDVPLRNSEARVSVVYQALPKDRLVRVIQIIFQSD